jgi:hypothetical protein
MFTMSSSRFCQAFFLGAVCFLLAQPAMAGSLRKVSVREVEVDLQASLADLLSSSSEATGGRLAKIETSIWQTFQSLPKNDVGRLAPAAVRHIVHSYFAKEHGWLIKGLEPHGMQANITHVHDVTILQDKVPLLVEELLEARQAGRGLALSDVVAMVAALEQLMFDESMTLLEAAYRLNEISVEEEVDESRLHTILRSYLVLFGQGAKADLTNVERHQAIIAARPRPELEEFENDEVLNFEYANRHQSNPFKSRQYSFQTVAKIMENLAQQYGKWQNSECRDMKAHLSELDSEGSGRVPLGLFYAQPVGSTYHFSESEEYLRKIGALDESSSSGAKVRIVNYVLGPSNCIASSSYYSVCCLSECDHILTELEHHVQAPAASADRLIGLVRNISHADLASGIKGKLEMIAARHGGEVPLHGRLFAQWLHFAFPRDCPYPSVVEDATALTPSQWVEGKSVASAQQREEHMSKQIPSTNEFKLDEQWSDHEVLMVHEESPSSLRTGSGLVRTFVQLAAICVAVRSAVAAWRSAAVARDGASKKKDDMYVLPLHAGAMRV